MVKEVNSKKNIRMRRAWKLFEKYVSRGDSEDAAKMKTALEMDISYTSMSNYVRELRKARGEA